MGKSYIKLKKQNEFLESKNAHLENWINILVENIVVLEDKVDSLKKESSPSHQFSEALKSAKRFVGELKTRGVSTGDAISHLRSGKNVQLLFCDDVEKDTKEKEIVDAPTKFADFTFGQELSINSKKCWFRQGGGNSGNCWVSFKSDMSDEVSLNKESADKLVVGAPTNFTVPEEVFVAIDNINKSKGFASRFMPNVKFKAKGHIKELNSIGIYCDNNTVLITRHDGKISLLCETGREKEVSIYEAIPELVPKGMVYDKRFDTLVKKVCVSQMCQGEFCDCDDRHSFIDPEKDKLAKKLNIKNGFEKKIVMVSHFSSSRFMPDVYFKVPKLCDALSSKFYKIYSKTCGCGTLIFGKNVFYSTGNGDKITVSYDVWEKDHFYNIVSIYEAIPELVPEGMMYVKEFDKLLPVKKFGEVRVDGVCRYGVMSLIDDIPKDGEGILKFAKELSRATGYSEGKCLSVIKDYGAENARGVLDFMASDIDPSVYKLKED